MHSRLLCLRFKNVAGNPTVETRRTPLTTASEVFRNALPEEDDTEALNLDDEDVDAWRTIVHLLENDDGFAPTAASIRRILPILWKYDMRPLVDRCIREFRCSVKVPFETVADWLDFSESLQCIALRDACIEKCKRAPIRERMRMVRPSATTENIRTELNFADVVADDGRIIRTNVGNEDEAKRALRSVRKRLEMMSPEQIEACLDRIDVISGYRNPRDPSQNQQRFLLRGSNLIFLTCRSVVDQLTTWIGV